jgi:hypothetical protein
MAIWLTTDRAEPGPVFGSKGSSRCDKKREYILMHGTPVDKFKGLGIFLDTCVAVFWFSKSTLKC